MILNARGLVPVLIARTNGDGGLVLLEEEFIRDLTPAGVVVVVGAAIAQVLLVGAADIDATLASILVIAPLLLWLVVYMHK
jgi:uncharacterized membrane protein